MNKLAKQKRESITRRTSWVVLFSYLIGGISALYAGIQYNKTLIDYKLPMLIAAMAGTIFSLLTSKYLREYSGKKFRYYGHLFWSILTFGGFITGLLFLINSVFGREQTETLKKPIVGVSHARRSGSVYAEINLVDYSKDIRFDSGERQQVEAANYVVLTTRKGFFGYSIIKEIRLTKE
ncbi:hypothetical protein [Pontibacter sp. HSC-36F09]|uniref:hypothetical protein n=1 Tax=Pontibacter sp. HSC-36F09 TaxID=2910966 RepID=UPI00209DAE4B|nr:hypothetical protein [Pontibacter sp. HSC-36F09]MCP2043086.1 hypothetical protein [Pontibacter sp. HSC-36F09]